MKKILAFRFLPIAWLLFVVLLLALLLRPGLYHLDPDLGWHLKIGRDTWLAKELPNDQIHLWTIPGATWVDHEWLTNAGMYLLYERWGYTGLNITFALIVLTAFLLIARHLKKIYPRADYFIMALLLLGYLAVLPHLGPRPQFITLLFLTLEFLILYQTARWHRFKTILLLGLFFWVWASLHAGFLIGLAVLALWAGEQIIMGWRRQAPKQFWLGLQAGCLSLVVTFLTPYGFKLYDFLGTYANTAYLKHISEWKPFYLFPIYYWQILFIAIVIAMIISLFSFKEKKLYLRPWQWLSLLMFLGLALKSVRHFPLFFAVASLTIIPIFLRQNMAGSTGLSLPRWAGRTLKIFLFSVLLILNIMSWWSLPRLGDPWQSFCGDYPCQAARQLQADPRYSQLKLFNKYDFGGWLIWVWPDKQLFIDGRMPQYPFAGQTLLEEYLEFTRPNTLAAKLKAYDIEAILWSNHPMQYQLNWLDKLLGFQDEYINGRHNYLQEWLEASPDWKKVFTDEAGSVYIRKDKL
jgi:hypothetical protein